MPLRSKKTISGGSLTTCSPTWTRFILSRAKHRPVSLRLSKRILRKWPGFHSLPHPKRMLP
eukprot:3024456-Prymnesium_polylepis.1